MQRKSENWNYRVTTVQCTSFYKFSHIETHIRHTHMSAHKCLSVLQQLKVMYFSHFVLVYGFITPKPIWNANQFTHATYMVWNVHSFIALLMLVIVGFGIGRFHIGCIYLYMRMRVYNCENCFLHFFDHKQFLLMLLVQNSCDAHEVSAICFPPLHFSICSSPSVYKKSQTINHGYDEIACLRTHTKKTYFHHWDPHWCRTQLEIRCLHLKLLPLMFTIKSLFISQ